MRAVFSIPSADLKHALALPQATIVFESKLGEKPVLSILTCDENRNINLQEALTISGEETK